jgi:hypothetical protein
MIDTTELSSYCPGYDEFIEPREIAKEYDYSDEYHDEFMIKGGCEIMHREIIKIDEAELTVKQMEKLVDYVWQGDYLIPIEMIGGE